MTSLSLADYRRDREVEAEVLAESTPRLIAIAALLSVLTLTPTGFAEADARKCKETTDAVS